MAAMGYPELRPLSLGEILDHAIRLYRKNLLVFVGIIAIVQIPLTALQTLFSSMFTSNALANFESTPGVPDFSFFGPWCGIMLTALAQILLLQFASAALTRAVADNYLGRPTGIADAYRRIRPFLPRILGALFLLVLLGIALFIWLLIPCIGWLTGFGVMVFVASVVTPLVAPIIVLEQKSAWDAIVRAWDIARRRFWWLVGFAFILAIFGQLVVTGPSLLLTYVLNLVTLQNQFDIASASVIRTIVQSLVNLVTSLIYLPLQLTAITVVYFDLRVRTEAFDLSLLAAGSGDAETGPDILARTATPAPAAKLVTGTELVYFAMLSFGVAGAWALLIGLVVLPLSMLMAGGAAGP